MRRGYQQRVAVVVFTVSNANTSIFDDEAPSAMPCNRLGQQAMLDCQHACRERRLIVAGQHGHRALRNAMQRPRAASDARV